jgi:hypothetical protein
VPIILPIEAVDNNNGFRPLACGLCGPEFHACALPTQHKLDFQHSTFLLWLKFCGENFHNLKKSMICAFSISHADELSGQNRCLSGTRNIESNTHGLPIKIFFSWDSDSDRLLLCFLSVLLNQNGCYKEGYSQAE